MRTKGMLGGFIGIAALLIAAQAKAVIINNSDHTDGGDVDELLASTDSLGNSGKQTEIDWVNDILNLDPDFTSMVKEEKVQWYSTDTDNVIAFALQSGPGYYLVKNAGWHVLFRNLSNFEWGVIDLTGLDPSINLRDNKKKTTTISHVSEFGASTPPPPPPTSVPEPGTLALLGMAALGLGLVRRRRLG